MERWWETEEGRKRLAVEKMMMNQTYPGCGKLILNRGENILCWEMSFKINFNDNIKECVVKIYYPKNNYPSEAPIAFVNKPNISGGCPHRYPSGNLCLFVPRYKKNGWDPSSSTAVTIASWSINWLIAYFTWKETGNWPGRQH